MSEANGAAAAGGAAPAGGPPSVLLGGLIDDAGQFPPARKPLEQAIADHRASRYGPHRWLLNRFLCPASRLGPVELPEPLGVVSDGDWEEDLDAAVAVGADAFELRDPGADGYTVLSAAPLMVFVEGAPDLEALAAHRLRAKLRCGGLEASAFPADADVAAFVAACRHLSLPFKATAGLHHPLRTVDERIGVVQHGFFNLLAAAGIDDADPLEIVADADPAAFAAGADGLAWRGRPVDAARARALFTGFGSCSFDEPVADLVALGAVEGAGA